MQEVFDSKVALGKQSFFTLRAFPLYGSVRAGLHFPVTVVCWVVFCAGTRAGTYAGPPTEKFPSFLVIEGHSSPKCMSSWNCAKHQRCHFPSVLSLLSPSVMQGVATEIAHNVASARRRLTTERCFIYLLFIIAFIPINVIINKCNNKMLFRRGVKVLSHSVPRKEWNCSLSICIISCSVPSF